MHEATLRLQVRILLPVLPLHAAQHLRRGVRQRGHQVLRREARSGLVHLRLCITMHGRTWQGTGSRAAAGCLHFRRDAPALGAACSSSSGSCPTSSPACCQRHSARRPTWRLPGGCRSQGRLLPQDFVGLVGLLSNTDWPYSEQIKRITLPHKCSAVLLGPTSTVLAAGCDNRQAAQWPGIFQKPGLTGEQRVRCGLGAQYAQPPGDHPQTGNESDL